MKLSLALLDFYKHVQVYVDRHCQTDLVLYRKDLLNLFEVKFGIPREQWKPDRKIDSMQSKQRMHGDGNTIAFVCQSYKTVAMEVHSSYDDTFPQFKAEALRNALCETLATFPDSVKVCDAFERSRTWMFFSLPLDDVFRLLTGVLDVVQSKAFDKNLSLFLPKATAVRMLVGGLPSLSLRPIRRIDGDWSNTGAAIAIPGYESHVLVCRSSGAYLVDVESNGVKEAVGDNLDVLKDCTALVSVGDKMYAFGCRLNEVTYKPLDSAFQCVRLGHEDWNGTLATCRYENAILAVQTRKSYGLTRTNLYYVDVNTGASQVLSKPHQRWRVAGALVNVADDEGKENIIAICGSLWQLNIELRAGGFTHVHSRRLDQAGQGNPLIEDWHCLSEYLYGRGWQFTQSAAVHNKELYVATGKYYLSGNIFGGLFRVDPFNRGAYSAVYEGWNTIQTVVDVNRYNLVVFTTNKLYVLDVD